MFLFIIMSQFGGNNAKKSSSDSKRNFTVVMGGKEHGLYVSSTPSSAAKTPITILCTANKSKKVEFSIREITQGSKKKTYGLKKNIMNGGYPEGYDNNSVFEKCDSSYFSYANFLKNSIPNYKIQNNLVNKKKKIMNSALNPKQKEYFINIFNKMNKMNKSLYSRSYPNTYFATNIQKLCKDYSEYKNSKIKPLKRILNNGQNEIYGYAFENLVDPINYDLLTEKMKQDIQNKIIDKKLRILRHKMKNPIIQPSEKSEGFFNGFLKKFGKEKQN